MHMLKQTEPRRAAHNSWAQPVPQSCIQRYQTNSPVNKQNNIPWVFQAAPAKALGQQHNNLSVVNTWRAWGVNNQQELQMQTTGGRSWLY